MEKLFGITGYFDYGKGICDEHSWRGTILIGENYWFEGLVQDRGSVEKRYITGTLANASFEGISLVKLINNTRLAPVQFSGINQNEAFNGMWDVILPGGAKRMGVSRILIEEREYTQDEVDALKAQIQSFKEQAIPFNKILIDYMEGNKEKIMTTLLADLEVQRKEEEKAKKGKKPKKLTPPQEDGLPF